MPGQPTIDPGNNAVYEPTPRPATPKRKHIVAIVVVYLACILLRGPDRFRLDGAFLPSDNPQIAEGQAWHKGTLTLPERYWDTALVDGKVYSHFPPMFSILSAVVAPFSTGFPRWVFLLFIVAPIPLLAYVLFSQITNDPRHAAVLSLALVAGTSLWPVIDRSLSTGGPWFVNQMLGTIGLLIFMIDYTGPRRLWPAAVGLVLAALSRQLTLLYFPALVLAARKPRSEGPAQSDASTPVTKQWWQIAVVLSALAVVVAATFALNAAKFGHPLDSGYMHIYEGRDDDFSRDARSFGIFSYHYIPRNLYYANLGFPQRSGPNGSWRPNVQATGIWWTTPLLLWVFADLRRIWGNRDSRWLLLCFASVYAVLLCYHSTGYAQRGYNRYSLDYVPVLMAMIAPRCLVGWRKWVSVPLIAWSVLYFAWHT